MLHFNYSYDRDYKRYKFKTTNTRHNEVNKTAKRQTYKSPKQITSAKKKDLLMLYEKGLIPKQHHAFFSSQTVTTSGRKIDDTDSNSHSGKEEDESSNVH